MPAVVARLLPELLGLLVEEVGDVGLWEEDDDDGQTDPCEDGEDPEDPAPGDPLDLQDTRDDGGDRWTGERCEREDGEGDTSPVCIPQVGDELTGQRDGSVAQVEGIGPVTWRMVSKRVSFSLFTPHSAHVPWMRGGPT